MQPISPFAPHKLARPAMRQIWRQLTFLHWRYPAALIAPAIPKPLTLDLFDGAAWVGLVPFTMAGVRLLGPPALPALPWLSHFPETNVRTYVRGPGGERGVWFFTLEASRLAAVMLARIWYHLPYRWAQMNVAQRDSRIEYRSKRSSLFGAGATDLAVEFGEPLQPTELDHFLTARFLLYAAAKNRVCFARIEHAPWPLRRAQVVRLNEDLIENSGLPRPEGEPLAHYSAEIAVQAESIQWLKHSS